jgi:hypothetical protein
MAAGAQRVLDRLAGGVEDIERRLSAAVAQMERLSAATVIPSPARRPELAALTCDHCGFVAKSPGGLAAHQRAHR